MTSIMHITHIIYNAHHTMFIGSKPNDTSTIEGYVIPKRSEVHEDDPNKTMLSLWSQKDHIVPSCSIVGVGGTLSPPQHSMNSNYSKMDLQVLEP